MGEQEVSRLNVLRHAIGVYAGNDRAGRGGKGINHHLAIAPAAIVHQDQETRFRGQFVPAVVPLGLVLLEHRWTALR